MDKQHDTPHVSGIDEWKHMKERLRTQENEADHEEDARGEGPSIRLRRAPGGDLIVEVCSKTTTKTARIEVRVSREGTKT